MDRGMRIYFKTDSGEVLVNTGEMQGAVTAHSYTVDTQLYSSLNELTLGSFDYIDLQFGQFRQDFIDAKDYRVNPETKELEFIYPDPNEPEQPPVYQKALSSQIKDLEKKTDEAIMELSMVIAMGGMS